MSEEMEREITYNADHMVTRYEIESRSHYERDLAAQRLRIAELEAEKLSDHKDIELYKQTRADLEKALDPIKSDIKELKDRSDAQLAINAATKHALMSMRKDIDDLESLTVRRIPNESITPGWGDIP